MKKLFRAVKKDGTIIEKFLDTSKDIPKCWKEVSPGEKDIKEIKEVAPKADGAKMIKKAKKKSKKRGKK